MQTPTYATLLQKLQEAVKEVDRRNRAVLQLVGPLRDEVVRMLEMAPEACEIGALNSGEFVKGRPEPAAGELDWALGITFRIDRANGFLFSVPIKVTEVGFALNVEVCGKPPIQVFLIPELDKDLVEKVGRQVVEVFTAQVEATH
jgi:hypothetical protein